MTDEPVQPGPAPRVQMAMTAATPTPNLAPEIAASSTGTMRREDLQALEGSNRGRLALLGGVVALGLGGAAWAFWPSGGIGNPEDPAKVMVVTQHSVAERFLDALGFDADGQTFDNLEEKAHAEVDGLDVEGVAAIVTLADQFGFGYVVFERPQNLDFSELDLESAPAIGEDDRYAVVSVGDLANPARMTVGPGLLETLFEQPQLAELVPPNQPTDVAAVELRDKLREAVDKVDMAKRRP